MVLEPGLGIPVAQGVVQPGSALERELPVERGVDPGGDLVRAGEEVRLDAAGAELQPELGGGDLVGRCLPAVGHVASGQLDEDGRLVVEGAVAAGRVDGGDDPASVAGEVVEVAERDLEAGDGVAGAGGEPERAGHGTGAAGDHDRERDLVGRHGRHSLVSDDEGGHQVAVPLVSAGPEGLDRVGQVGVAGREDGRVVEEAGPHGWQESRHGATLAMAHIPDE